MKQFILILTAIFLTSSCSNDDKKLDTNSIVGTWKLYEANIGEFKYTKVNDGYTYTFNSNGTFKSTRFTNCITGKYTVSADKLTLDYDCDEFTTQTESPTGTYIETYKLEKGYLYLSPTYIVCYEGCSYKFNKISD